MKAATHNGHCQVCGKVQALPFDGKLSLHGYKVAGLGFFSGVCQGARHLPLQQERTITDSIIVALGEYAERMDTAAAAYQAGTKFPSKAWSGKYVKVTKTNRRGSYQVEAREEVDFELAPVIHQREEVQRATYQCKSEARNARSHAESLVRLADEIHGTELIPVVESTVPTSRDLAAGDVLTFDGYRAITLVRRTYVRRGFRGSESGGWEVTIEGRGSNYTKSDSEISRAIGRAVKAGTKWRNA